MEHESCSLGSCGCVSCDGRRDAVLAKRPCVNVGTQPTRSFEAIFPAFAVAFGCRSINRRALFPCSWATWRFHAKLRLNAGPGSLDGSCAQRVWPFLASSHCPIAQGSDVRFDGGMGRAPIHPRGPRTSANAWAQPTHTLPMHTAASWTDSALAEIAACSAAGENAEACRLEDRKSPTRLPFS